MDVKPVQLRAAEDVAAIVHARQGLKEILYHAPDAIVCICLSGKIAEFNAKAEELFDCSRADAMGRGFLDVCTDHSDRLSLYAELRRLEGGEPANRIRTMLKRREGETRVLEWSFSTVDSNGDGATLIVASARDVTGEAGIRGFSRGGTGALYNPDFDETVDLVLSGLSAIIERLETVSEKGTPGMLESLKQYYEEAETDRGVLSGHKTEAIERLILSLIDPGKEYKAAEAGVSEGDGEIGVTGVET